MGLGVGGVVKWLRVRCEKEYGFLVDYRPGMGEGGWLVLSVGPLVIIT